jgi:hypothetical protein
MWIGFLVAAVLVFLGGVAGSYVLYYMTDLIPPGIGEMLPKIENFGVAAGLAISMLGLALVYRKLARIERVMGGRTPDGRLRRTRISTRGEGSDDEGKGEGGVSRPGSGLRRATSASSRTRASAREGSDDSEEPAGAGRTESPARGKADGAEQKRGAAPAGPAAGPNEPLSVRKPSARQAAVVAPQDDVVPVSDDDILPSDAAMPAVQPPRGTGVRQGAGASGDPGGAVKVGPLSAPAVDGSTKVNMSTYEVMQEIKRRAAGGAPLTAAPAARKPVARNTARTRMLKREIMEQASGGRKAGSDDTGDEGDEEATGLMPPVGQ